MKLHLGCGKNYLDGWVNIDFDSSTADVHLDLRKVLPYPDDSVNFIFNEHFIEHITQNEALLFLHECRRVLKPDGILRISTPNLSWVITMYLEGILDEWKDVDWVPESRCKLINEAMRCWGHIFIYDLDEIMWLLNKAGFKNIEQVPWRTSSHPELSDLECRPDHREIILEASF